MLSAFKYQSSLIRRDEKNPDFINLTDMWKAAGSIPNKKPADWLRSPGAKEFLEYLEEFQGMGFSHTLHFVTNGNPKTGDGGSSWAHWQVALAYAKYLSPSFHAWGNSVIKATMESHSPTERAINIFMGLVHDLSDLCSTSFGSLSARLDGIERGQTDISTRLLTHVPATQDGPVSEVTVQALKDAVKVMGHTRGLKSGFAHLRQEKRIATYKYLSQKQADDALAWVKSQTIVPQPVREPDVRHEVPRRTTTWNDKDVGKPREPYCGTVAAIITGVNEMLGRTTGLKVDVYAVEGILRLEGLHGAGWTVQVDGKTLWTWNTVEFIYHTYQKTQAVNMGRPVKTN